MIHVATGTTHAMHLLYSLTCQSTITLGEGGAIDQFLDWWRHLWLRSEGGTELARTTDDMYMWIWWFCVLWFVFLMTLYMALKAIG